VLERTRQTVVIFNHPATLQAGEIPLAAGSYIVETDEELIPGLSFIAYRRLRTRIIHAAASAGHAVRQMSEVDADDLAAALARDVAPRQAPTEAN
jgi:hypothetical protein